MTDNGAKALAERLYTLVSVEDHGQLCPVWSRRKHPAEKAECDCWVQPQSAERADAILANGAVFLTAEEAERLRRIETAARQVFEANWKRPYALAALRAALTDPEPSP